MAKEEIRDKIEDIYIKETNRLAFLETDKVDIKYVEWLERRLINDIDYQIGYEHGFDNGKEYTQSNNDWTEYSFENKDSHPPTSGRYLIYREKCNKLHFEQWNGSGWSSSNKDCTHWKEVQLP